MATYSVVRGDELYVYVRGVLVYKRWLKTGVSVTLYEAGLPRWSISDETRSRMVYAGCTALRTD